MKVELEKGKLVAIGNYLYGLKLVRKQSRMRRRLINLIEERNKEYSEDRKELQEHHARKDEDGKPIIKDEQYDIPDIKAFSEDLKELNEEKVIFEGEDYREMIKTLQKILLKFEEEEYEGQESEVYDYLCDVFKVDDIEETPKGGDSE